jgi:hypothetical protein
MPWLAGLVERAVVLVALRVGCPGRGPRLMRAATGRGPRLVPLGLAGLTVDGVAAGDVTGDMAGRVESGPAGQGDAGDRRHERRGRDFLDLHRGITCLGRPQRFAVRRD